MLRRLLTNRDVRIYLAGQMLSDFGDMALFLATGIWVKMLTGSSSAAGLTMFMVAFGSMGGPLGGMLADRLRRRPLLIAVNLAACALILSLLFVRDSGQLWLIYLVMVGYGLVSSVISPAQAALLQTLVPQDLLGDANGVLQTAGQGMRLISPLIGAGLLVAFGATPVIVGDAATFLVAVIALLALKVHEESPRAAHATVAASASNTQNTMIPADASWESDGERRHAELLAGSSDADGAPNPAVEQRHTEALADPSDISDTPEPVVERWYTEALAGARQIGADPALRTMCVAAVLAVITFGFSETGYFTVVADGLHRSPSFLAVMVSVQGVGAIGAGILAAGLIRRIGELRTISAGLACLGVAYALLAVPITAVALLGSVLLGVSLPWVIVGSSTLLQRRTPPRLMGRTTAAYNLLTGVPQTAAIAVGAAVFAALEYRIPLAAMAAVALGSAVFLRARAGRREVPAAAPLHQPADYVESAPDPVRAAAMTDAERTGDGHETNRERRPG